MRNYIIKRVLQMIPALLIISLLVFSLLYITPGDPVLLLLSADSENVYTQEDYDRVEAELGLDKPFFERYVNFLVNALHGDLGTSYITGKDVFEEIMTRFPATLLLTFASMILALVISIPLGIVAALKQNSIWDNLCTFMATVSVSLPKFWFALLLMLLFALELKWLPSQGIAWPSDGWGSFISHLILPSVAMALGLAATQTRMIRSSMLDVLNQDYVRFARSKGFKEYAVIIRHALKNAMIPIVTIVASEFGSLLGGSVITEQIFSWPGIGRLAVTSIGRRDYAMIQGITLMMCFLYLVINLLVDIIYAFLDPRIRFDKK